MSPSAAREAGTPVTRDPAAWLRAAARLAGGHAEAFFSDLAVRQGIKFALAGTLSFYAALVLRLDQPSWAVTTAFVLSTPKFVGAIAEKTLLRIIGAAAGAVLGYVITGALEQTPALFLLAFGTLVAVTTALYGGTLAPYGFRQCGYTATIVAAQGLADPAFSWKVGLARCEEIVLGIVVTSVVTFLVWPRYAREDFERQARGALLVLAGLLDERTKSFLGADTPVREDVFGRMAGPLSTMRKMIRLGSFESRDFRARSARIDQVVSSLGAVSRGIATLGDSLSPLPELRATLEKPIREAAAALAHAMRALAEKGGGRTPRLRALDESRAALDGYRRALEIFRQTGGGARLGARESLEHAGFGTQMHAIRRALETLEAAMTDLEESQRESFPMVRFRPLTMPPAGWIKAGIRGGLAVAASLALLNWAHPPGGEMIVVGNYLFTAFVLESNDRRGDLGVYSDLLKVAAYCAGFFILLLLAAPMLSSFAVMNIVLAAILFGTGCAGERPGLTSFMTLFWMLIAANVVELNAQRAVGFEAVAAAPLGLLIAATLSAVFRRTIWPVLPQTMLNKRACHVLDRLSGILKAAPAAPPTSVRAALTLELAESRALVSVLETRMLEPAGSAPLHNHLNGLARAIGGAITGIEHDADGIPDALRDEYNHRVAALRHEAATRLLLQRDALRARVPPPACTSAHDAFMEWAAAFREKLRIHIPMAGERVRALGLLHSHTLLARGLDESGDALRDVNFPRVFGDWKL